MRILSTLVRIFWFIPAFYMRVFQKVFLYIHPELTPARPSDAEAAISAPVPTFSGSRTTDLMSKQTHPLVSLDKAVSTKSSPEKSYSSTTTLGNQAWVADDAEEDLRAFDNDLSDELFLQLDFAKAFASSKALLHKRKPSRQQAMMLPRMMMMATSRKIKTDATLMTLSTPLESPTMDDTSLEFLVKDLTSTTTVAMNHSNSVEQDSQADAAELDTPTTTAEMDSAQPTRPSLWNNLLSFSSHATLPDATGDMMIDNDDDDDVILSECESLEEAWDSVSIHRQCDGVNSTEELLGLGDDIRRKVCFQDPSDCLVEFQFDCQPATLQETSPTFQHTLGGMKYTCLNLEAIRQGYKIMEPPTVQSLGEWLMNACSNILYLLVATIFFLVAFMLYLVLHCFVMALPVPSTMRPAIHNTDASTIHHDSASASWQQPLPRAQTTFQWPTRPLPHEWHAVNYRYLHQYHGQQPYGQFYAMPRSTAQAHYSPSSTYATRYY